MSPGDTAFVGIVLGTAFGADAPGTSALGISGVAGGAGAAVPGAYARPAGGATLGVETGENALG